MRMIVNHLRAGFARIGESVGVRSPLTAMLAVVFGGVALGTASSAWAGSGASFFNPVAASQHARGHDVLFEFIFWLCMIFFVLIVAAMVWFAWRFRRLSEDQPTIQIEGNTALEIWWSVIPSILLVVIFIWGYVGWIGLSVAPADAMTVRVYAKKWAWSFDYPKENVAGATDLVVPVGRPVKVILSADDVLHSFWIPALRIKRDAIPGRYTTIWFEADREGDYDLLCAEYCGTQHSKMRAQVKVVSEAEFKKWIEADGGRGDLPPIALGEKIFNTQCIACHTTTGVNGIGPTMLNVYGKTEEMTDGSKVVVDDDYLRESILNPNAKIVKGFAPAMPPFKDRLSEKEIGGLIEFIKAQKK